MIVVEIKLEFTVQMPFFKDDDMIERVSSDTADYSPAIGILPRTSRCCLDFFGVFSSPVL